MKRVVATAIVATVIVAAIAGFLLLPRLATPKTARDGLAATLTAWTGREVRIEGPARLSLGLSVALEVGPVAVAGPGGDFDVPLLTAEGATATLRLPSLLVGRAAVDEIALDSPRLVLRRDGAGAPTWPVAEGAIGELAGGAVPGDVRFGRVAIADGSILYVDEAALATVELAAVEGVVAWPSTARALSFNGRFVWRGEQVALEADLTRPAALLGGGDSRLRFSAAAEPLSVAFSGTAHDLDALQLEGAFEADSPDAAAAAAWLRLPPVVPAGAVSLAGDVNWIERALSLANATVDLAGNRGEGAVTLDFGVIPAVGGTLAFDTLDLTGAATALAALAADATPFAGDDAVSRGLRDVQADLRLSAAKVRIGDTETGPAAFALSIGDGHGRLTVGDWQVAGGRVQGDLAVERTWRRLDATAHGTFADIDAAKFATLLGQPRVLEGTAEGRFDLTASGDSPAALLAAATGPVAFAIADGRLTGFDLDALFELGVGRRPYAFDGHIDFRSATGTLSPTTDGFSVDDAAIETGDRRITGDGDLSLAADTFSATMVLPPREDGASRPKTLIFSGTFDAPMVRVAAPAPTDDATSDIKTP